MDPSLEKNGPFRFPLVAHVPPIPKHKIFHWPSLDQPSPPAPPTGPGQLPHLPAASKPGPIKRFLTWANLSTGNNGIRRIRIGLLFALIAHTAFGLVALGLGIKADIDNPYFKNYLEAKQGYTPYTFPLISLSSLFFFLEALGSGFELYMTYQPTYTAWISKRTSPVSWLTYAITDSWLGAIQIMLQGIQGVGYIFQYAILRALIELVGGWLVELWAASERDALTKYYRPRIPWPPAVLAILVYFTTVAVRWLSFFVGEIDNGLPAFVWVAFFASHLELLLPAFLTLSIYQTGPLRHYANFKLCLIALSFFIKATLGMSIAIGSYLESS